MNGSECLPVFVLRSVIKSFTLTTAQNIIEWKRPRGKQTMLWKYTMRRDLDTWINREELATDREIGKDLGIFAYISICK